MDLHEFRDAARTAVAASVAPYGYTLTVWTSGAVLTHARGIPTTVDALLFMGGAVAGFGSVGFAVFGGFRARLAGEARPTLWSGIHAASIALAIGAAALVAHLVRNVGAWPLTGFAVTVIYLCAVAFQLALSRDRGP
ncbi:MAG TPA: hypothetical protein VH816_04500 [Gaiellaceae bacterium]|jgi:hypothetical protein